MAQNNTLLDEDNIKLRLLQIAHQYATSEASLNEIYERLLGLFNFQKQKHRVAT